jgi:hypothetical protein
VFVGQWVMMATVHVLFLRLLCLGSWTTSQQQ